jgi:hypothetical protein
MPADSYSPTLYMYYFGKQGGGTPSQPVPVTLPNDLDVPPGTQLQLWYFDEAPDGSRPNQWAQYGTGTVSSDGSQIVPDTDPSTGRPYGQPRFCCGANRAAIGQANLQIMQAERGGPGTGKGKVSGGEPVDLATGIFTLAKTDLVLPGRLPIVFTRTYRSLGPTVGPFGPGTSHSYYVLLLIEQSLRTLILPDGTRFPFLRQPDGTYRNGADPAVRGAVLRDVPGQAIALRFKDGTTWVFDGNGFLLSQTDRNGNALTFTYQNPGDIGAPGVLLALTEPSGRSFTFTQAFTGLAARITSRERGRRHLKHFSLDGRGPGG